MLPRVLQPAARLHLVQAQQGVAVTVTRPVTSLETVALTFQTVDVLQVG